MRDSTDQRGALALKFYLQLKKARNFPLKSRILRKLRQRYEAATGPVPASLHGFPIQVNPGNTYPFIIQETKHFNAPLIELVHQVFLTKNAPLNFVDVGAAIGDTVLLIKHRCPEQVAQFFCIEGDAEFYGLLSANMAQFTNVVPVQVVLARKSMNIRSLVKHHQGTAAAMGDNFITAVELDSVKQVRQGAVDVLKIDVDGFDGEILAGARDLLRSHQPAVIFEWHPKLVQATGNDPLTAFQILSECGYNRFLWFNNVGTFSHFSDFGPTSILAKENAYLLKVNHRADEHFDIIALSESSLVDEVTLAALDYARAHLKRSAF